METADNQLKTCEKIIHRLYGENSDLTKENLSLEGKLKSASRSQDKLQRRKVLLQKLVDKLSGHIGKDVLQQSYLVLELDKEVSLWVINEYFVKKCSQIYAKGKHWACPRVLCTSRISLQLTDKNLLSNWKSCKQTFRSFFIYSITMSAFSFFWNIFGTN